MRYAGPTRLPLNASALDGCFAPATPGVADAGEPGVTILFCGENLVLDAAPREPTPLLRELPPELEASEALLFGRWRGEPVRVRELVREALPSSRFQREPLLHLLFTERLSDELLTLAGRAQQLLYWERTSAACSRCGGAQERIAGTWGKRCRACGGERFPQIQPCAVVLVRRRDELLLVRKPGWPAGYYSLPSGFCDFTESLEECARREVREETGVEIGDLRYAGSQSWPFPSQLMVGFTASHTGGGIAVDRSELEDAAWFAVGAPFRTFSSRALAGWMIEQERARRGPEGAR